MDRAHFVKNRGIFGHFVLFLAKISTLRQENCFIEAFAVQWCHFRYYVMLIALTLPKIGQHGLDMACLVVLASFYPFL